MSNDLEDFLRRAAQRRQAKAQQQQTPQRPVRPQYSDSRRERVVEAELVDEPMVAEIVEEETDSLAARRRRLEQSRQAAAEAQASAKKARQNVKVKATKGSAAGGHVASGSMDLVHMLTHPDGIRNAILLREILDRPEHRW